MSIKDTAFIQKSTINCNGKILDLSSPIVMGILNVTPDSFYDGGKYSSVDQALQKAESMLRDGASILDIGGCSSRPGAKEINEQEEIGRVIPIIRKIRQVFPETIISIDSFNTNVVQSAIEEGANIVNDISAFEMDKQLLKVIVNYKIPYVLMHMQGTPQSMQENPCYDDIITDITNFFNEKINILKSNGLNDIILDLGFGFGKTLEDNFKLLSNLSYFKNFNLPILAGISRKSMIYKLLDTDPENALNGTTAAHVIALQQGAKILRVHDVKPAIDAIKIVEYCDTFG